MNLSELMSTVETICHVTISMEVLAPNVKSCQNLTLPHDQYLHHSDQCRKHKLSGDFAICRQTKQRSIDIARRWKRTFCGFCPNHIWDLAVPVIFQDELVAVIYLGGLDSPAQGTKRRELRQYGNFIRQFILIELTRYAQKLAPHRKRRDSQFYVDNALQFIEEKYSENISLAQLAKQLKVAPDHLGRQLQMNTGKSFRQLLCLRRLKQSEVLVRLHFQLNVTQIAHLCGFTDSNYFSVVFKKHFGMPPTEYRQAHATP